MYNDSSLAKLFDWSTQELEALVLQSELSTHDKTAEIEQDLENAPTQAELEAGALNPAQATVVDKYLDIRMRAKDGERATAVRNAQIALFQELRKVIDEIANGDR